MTAHCLLATSLADEDVEAAFRWYEEQRAGIGLDFLNELQAAYARIAEGPYWYQDLGHGTRRALLRRFPFAVYFNVDAETVLVIAVIHVSRHPSRWQERQR